MEPRHPARRGASAVEFALLLPVFLAIVFGSADVGWFMWSRASAILAVHDGCRAGSLVDPGLHDVVVTTATTAAINKMKADLPGCVGCGTTASVVGVVPTRAMSCSVTVPYHTLVNVLPSTNAKASALVRMEYQRTP